MKKLIIYHPEKQDPTKRWVLRLITTTFWMFWIYLWLPFVSLLAWIFGIRIFEYQMIELGGYEALLELLGVYFTIIFLLGGGLIAWASYNIWRFGGESNLRKPRPIVSMEMQAQHFNVEAKDVEEWRKSQRLVIDHGNNSQITRISIT